MRYISGAANGEIQTLESTSKQVGAKRAGKLHTVLTGNKEPGIDQINRA
jgi:hypothetical protein